MQRQQEINSRNQYIKSLNEFLISAKSFLGDTIQDMNWKESATVKKDTEKPLITCPLDPSHRLSSGNLDKHLEMCRWHRFGYQNDDIPFPPRPSVLPASSVVIDKNLQRDIILSAAKLDPSLKIREHVHNREVPQTSDRFFSDFTTDERRILYDYTVAKTAAVMPQLKEFNLTAKPEGQSAPMTREQLMAAERDAKRRRVKHRTAKVHTKSKNYSEVLREVINNQMIAYEDWIKENFGNEKLAESVQPETKRIEEAKQEKQEMVWLDLDFRFNPHTRWKHILEKEKRLKNRSDEKCERNKDREKEKKLERKRDIAETDSRRYHHKEKYRERKSKDESKRDYHHPTHDHDESHSKRKGNDSSRGDSHHYSRGSHSKQKESCHSKRDKSYRSRDKEDRYEEKHSKPGSYHSRDREDKYEEKHSKRDRSYHSRGREDEYEEKHFKRDRSHSRDKKDRYEEQHSKPGKHKKHKHDKEYTSRYREKNEYDPNEKRPGGSELNSTSKRKWDRYGVCCEFDQGEQENKERKLIDENSEDTKQFSYYSFKPYVSNNGTVKKEYDTGSSESE